MSSASCKIISPTGHGAVAGGIGKCNYVFKRTNPVAMPTGNKLIGNHPAISNGDSKLFKPAIKLWTSNVVQVPIINSGNLTGGGQLIDVVQNANDGTLRYNIPSEMYGTG